MAGFAVVWRNWLVQHPAAEAFIQKNLGSFAPVLICGSCFTYWLALALVVYHNPLAPFALSFTSRNGPAFALVRLMLSWMALAYLSVLLRFTYILVQEKVSILVHAHEQDHR